jgi:hypothetical protein
MFLAAVICRPAWLRGLLPLLLLLLLLLLLVWPPPPG